MEKRFKSVTFGFTFLLPIDSNKAAVQTLLSRLLTKRVSGFSSKEDLSIYLQNLYNADLFCHQTKFGRTRIIFIIMKILNPTYVEQNNTLLTDSFTLLKKVVFDSIFNELDFEIEKANLIDEKNAIFDNKLSYGRVRFLETMFEGEAFIEPFYGTINDIKLVSLQDVIDEYKMLLFQQHFAFFSGDVSLNVVLTELEKFVFPETINQELVFFDYEKKHHQEIIMQNEFKKFNQSSLFMGYRTDIYECSNNFKSLTAFNCIFGGISSSKLFKVVREELGLCYYINSTIDSTKGFLTVISFIAKDSKDQVINSVNQILDEIKNGDFLEEDLELVKKSMIMIAHQKYDRSNETISYGISKVCKIPIFSLEEELEQISNISKKDIMSVAKKISLDTIYFLEGE